jgi:hypothetical protein
MIERESRGYPTALPLGIRSGVVLVTTSLVGLTESQIEGGLSQTAGRSHATHGFADADRPPACPVCQRRLVILTSRSWRNGNGAYSRRQLWGCPRGHATAEYADGMFGEVDLLPEY